MHKLFYLSCFILIVVSVGCKVNIFEPDITPPAVPQGVSTTTGDNQIEIFWSRNAEPDLAGYHVLVSDVYDGKYEIIGTTSQPYFVDKGSHNGITYYYAITAFDYSGNESELSRDVAYDTPRPEGYDIILKDYHTAPNLSGYDFSTYSIGPYDDKYTDVFFEYYHGEYYLNVWTDTDIQDVGYTKSLYDIGEAPEAGWSPTKDVRVIVGHTYVVWTWDDHYAKVRINAVSSTRVDFHWAYQLQSGNTRLKRTVTGDRNMPVIGEGAKSRQ